MADEIDPLVAALERAQRVEDYKRIFGRHPDEVSVGADTAHFAREQAPSAAMAALPVAAQFPRLTAALAGPLAYFATPGHAENEAKPKDYVPQGLLKELLSLLPGQKPDDERPLTREQYIQQNRRIQPKSQSDYIQNEVDKARGTERYQEAGPKLRANLESEARANADKLYQG